MVTPTAPVNTVQESDDVRFNTTNNRYNNYIDCNKLSIIIIIHVHVLVYK